MTGGQALLFIHCAGRLIINNSPNGVGAALDSLRRRRILFPFSKVFAPLGWLNAAHQRRESTARLHSLRRRKQMTNLSRWGVFNFSTARAVSHLFWFRSGRAKLFFSFAKITEPSLFSLGLNSL